MTSNVTCISISESHREDWRARLEHGPPDVLHDAALFQLLLSYHEVDRPDRIAPGRSHDFFPETRLDHRLVPPVFGAIRLSDDVLAKQVEGLVSEIVDGFPEFVWVRQDV